MFLILRHSNTLVWDLNQLSLKYQFSVPRTEAELREMREVREEDDEELDVQLTMNPPYSMILNDKNLIVAFGSQIKKYDLRTGSCVSTIETKADSVNCIRRVRDEYILSGSARKDEISMWDFRYPQEREVSTFSGFGGSTKFTYDGTKIVSMKERIVVQHLNSAHECTAVNYFNHGVSDFVCTPSLLATVGYNSVLYDFRVSQTSLPSHFWDI
eukprot:TRINITY_DN6665_c0_g1_i3.p1 TRINITY_DN6665_c0_g1~~TRINITY_DN6665_c0_g1_i3.p1  ORF type:complete len:213 (-),score=30.04 TRINITY_DN6665_c0_g1_i3:80-718(-)